MAPTTTPIAPTPTTRISGIKNTSSSNNDVVDNGDGDDDDYDKKEGSKRADGVGGGLDRRRVSVLISSRTVIAAVVVFAVIWQQTRNSNSSSRTTFRSMVSSSLSSLLLLSSSSHDDGCRDQYLGSTQVSFLAEEDADRGPKDDNYNGNNNNNNINKGRSQRLSHPRYECTHDELSNFLVHHDNGGTIEMTGMHLVCLHRHNRSMTFFRGMSPTNKRTISFYSTSTVLDREDDDNSSSSSNNNNDYDDDIPTWESLVTWGTMKEVLHSSLEFDTMSAARIVPFGPEWSRDNWKLQFEPQPWTIFSVDGQQRLIHQSSSPCESTRSLWETGMFLVMEGGQFFWPPVRVGFKRQINMMTSPSTDGKQQINSSMDTQGGGNTYSRRNVTLETLSVQPLILSVDDFFDNDECTYVRDAAQPKLKYSDSAIHDRDDGETFGWSRTGSSTIIRKIEPKLQSLTRRLAQLVRVHVTHLEPTTVSKYRIGEYYGPHHDYFEPTLYSGDPATIRLLENGLRNRMISIFWYLSDLPQQQQQQNGATSFPLVSKVPLDEACNTGLQVPPKKGKVVIMYNIHPDGSVDPNAINADCPVQRGVKWLTNLYVWNKPVLASRYA